jgi:hypothetical protein
VTADLRGRHDLGQIVGFGYRLYLRNFVPFFLIALLTVPLELLTGVLEHGADSDSPRSIAAQFLSLPNLAVGIIVSAAMIRMAHDVTAAAKAEAGAALDAALSRVVELIGTLALAIVLVLGAALSWPWLALWWLVRRGATIDGRRNWWLVALPGVLVIYLVVRWQFWQQTVMIEGRRNWAALDASAALVGVYWWRTLGILLVIGLIQLGPLVLATAARELPPLPGSLIAGLVLAAVLPFAAIAQTLLYYDLKARTHAADTPDGVAAAAEDVPGEST